MKHATSAMLLVLALAACDPEAGEPIDGEASVVLAGDPAPTLDVDNPEGLVEYPVDTIELSNGNLLEFYANEASGWTGVIESVMPDNPSILDSFAEGTSALEIFLRASEADHPIPDELLAASRSVEVEQLVEQTPRGAIEQLDVLVKPSATDSWCDAETFIDDYCTDGGLFDTHQCLVNWYTTPGQLAALSTSPTIAYRAAYCHTGATSTTSLVYREAYFSPVCEPQTISWLPLWSAINDVSKNYSFGGSEYPREFKLYRYSPYNSVAHYGHKWNTDECG